MVKIWRNNSQAFFGLRLMNAVYNPLRIITVISTRPTISPSRKTQNQTSIAIPKKRDNGTRILVGNLFFKKYTPTIIDTNKTTSMISILQQINHYKLIANYISDSRVFCTQHAPTSQAIEWQTILNNYRTSPILASAIVVISFFIIVYDQVLMTLSQLISSLESGTYGIK